MSLKFVNLHGHTGASVYDGLGSPEDYSEFMLKNAGEDSGALAITNHGNMNDIGYMVAAQNKYKKSGAPVKFLYGCEAYYIPSVSDWTIAKRQWDEEKKDQKNRRKEEEDSSDLVIENESESKDWTKKYYNPVNRRNHLVLVATNYVGMQNLFRLVSRSYREGFYKKPRIDLDMLRKCNEGLMVSTACLAGLPTWCSFHPDAKESEEKIFSLYDKELGPLMEIFGKERFYLELQFNRISEQNVVNKHIVEYSKRTGFDLIATADSHYASPHMFRDRELYRLLGYQMRKTKDIDKSILDKSIEELDCELYLKNGDQMFQAYKETFADICPDEQLIKDAIERTYHIGHDLCEFIDPDSKYKLPQTFQVTEKIKTSFDKLKEFALNGLKDKKLFSKEYLDRTAYELNVIKKLEVEEYFLTKKSIVDVLRQHMLVGPGRGSGAGSLVCYLLGITMLDPVKNGLLFERFMSPSRAEMPDIDSDFELKDQALDILKDHFGDENVLAISNYNRLQLRSLVKDISKLYDVPYSEVNAITKTMEQEAREHIMEEIGHDQKLYEFTFEKAKKYSKTFRDFLEKYPQIGDRIQNLYQEVKSIGRHAGGVLVVPDAESCLPIIKIRDTYQSPITEGLTAQHLQYFGLIKFDVLGLATLKIIRRCIEEVLRNECEINNPTIEDVWDWYDKNLHPEVIDPCDKLTFEKVYHAGKWPSIFQFTERNVQKFCQKAKPQSVGDISALTALWRPGPLCLSGNSTVTVDRHGKKKTMKEMHEQFTKQSQRAKKCNPLQVLSLNEKTHKFVKNKVKDVVKSGRKKVWKILFQRESIHDVEKISDSSCFKYAGYEDVVLATEEHFFLTKSGWKKLGDFVVGEYLCTKRRSDYVSNDPKNDDVQYVCFLKAECIGEVDTYDLVLEDPHRNFVAGGFVVHNSGGADKKYLWATEPDKINDLKKEHPIIQKVLGDTRGLLLYQEQFMLLAHELAGFSLEEANNLRKILVKIDQSKAEETKKARQEYGSKFIKGCIKHGVPKDRAERLWNDEIIGFISYGFNKSHAQCYAYNSYQCAWLYAHYPNHWLKSCLECDPNLEKTINVVRGLGLKVNKPDVNVSSVSAWHLNDKSECAPPFISLKGVGESAATELVSARSQGRFKDIEDFLWDQNGNWRWSKLNKKVFQVLMKAEAFDSLECVGKDKLFKNYKHMNDSFFEVDKFDRIKRKRISLEDLAAQANSDDWNTAEKVVAQKEIFGFYDKSLVIGPFQETFDSFSIQSIDEVPDELGKPRVWGLVEKVIEKVSKNKKPFLTITASGMSDKPYVFRIWNASLSSTNVWGEGNIVIFSLDYDKDWGYNLSRRDRPIRVTK